MNSLQVDRLVILTVSGMQMDALVSHLTEKSFRFTVINTSGGLLNEPEACLLIGLSSKRLQLLLEIVREDCHPFRQFVSTQGYMQGEMASPSMVEVELGGAKLYVMNVERFEQI
jgi:uncharacterized protein YaaQ